MTIFPPDLNTSETIQCPLNGMRLDLINKITEQLKTLREDELLLVFKAIEHRMKIKDE